MSMIIGIAFGIAICWYAHKTLGLKIEAQHHTPQERPKPPVASKVQAIQSTKPFVAAKPATASMKKPSVKADSKSTAAPQDHMAQSQKDDLKKIGGIGPKIAAILNNDGVITFQQLSEKKPAEIKTILDKAGGRYRASDLSTWTEQALYAAKGDWKGAKEAWARSK